MPIGTTDRSADSDPSAAYDMYRELLSVEVQLYSTLPPISERTPEQNQMVAAVQFLTRDALTNINWVALVNKEGRQLAR